MKIIVCKPQGIVKGFCVLRVILFSDSDATVSSESDGEGARERDREAGKK